MTAAPLSTSARAPTAAPAASNSASAMEAPAPAPFSTATSAPSAMNFLTVSEMAAQRLSPAASFRTAIFTALFQDQKDDKPGNQANDRAIFHHPREARVIVNMDGDVLRRRVGKDGLVVGHEKRSSGMKLGHSP